MSDQDFNFETSPGIPAPLPKGEDILWQGRPDAGALAREAFKIRWITGYMVILALWQAGSVYADGGAGQAIARLIPYLALAAAAYAVVYLLAAVQARAAVYTITNSRVIMRVGAALPVTYTIPFVCIDAASLSTVPGKGTGTIALETKGNIRLSYAVLWPHVRPGFVRHPQPALRAIPEASHIARILADAAQAKVNEPRVSRDPAQAPGLVAAE